MTAAPRHGPRRGRRLRLVLLVAAVGLAVTVLAGAAMNGTLVYYQTPTEVRRQATGDQRVRVGGTVVPGSLHRTGDRVRFALTDGAARLDVSSTVRPPQTFGERRGAVVEGAIGADGVLRADRVLMKHSNSYSAEREQPAPRPGVG